MRSPEFDQNSKRSMEVLFSKQIWSSVSQRRGIENLIAGNIST